MSQSEPDVVNASSPEVEIVDQAQCVDVHGVEGTSSNNSNSWRRWGLPILTAILGPILLLAILEAGLRLADVGFPTALLQPCTVEGQPASCYNLFFVAPFFPPGMIKAP